MVHGKALRATQKSSFSRAANVNYRTMPADASERDDKQEGLSALGGISSHHVPHTALSYLAYTPMLQATREEVPIFGPPCSRKIE
jgi:hypothetical protein